MSLDDRLVRLVSGHLGVNAAEVKPEARFAEDLRADSLDIVEVIIAIEREYGIAIPDAEDGGVSTVQDAAALIERYAGTTPCHVDERP